MRSSSSPSKEEGVKIYLLFTTRPTYAPPPPTCTTLFFLAQLTTHAR
jgi:hypothetical protein